MTPTDTLKFIQRGNQHTDVSRSLVFAWHKKFRDGLDDVFDKPRSGRPCRGDIISEDRRRSVREISDLTGICVNVVYRILTDTLKMNNVCARWVPRLLTQDQKTTRVQMSRSFLDRFDREEDQFLHRIVNGRNVALPLRTRVQTAIHGMETLRFSTTKKVRTSKSAGKFMFMFFMDARGLILQHAVPLIIRSYVLNILYRGLLYLFN